MEKQLGLFARAQAALREYEAEHPDWRGELMPASAGADSVARVLVGPVADQQARGLTSSSLASLAGGQMHSPNAVVRSLAGNVLRHAQIAATKKVGAERVQDAVRGLLGFAFRLGR